MPDIKKNVYELLLEVQKKAHAPREINGKFGKARSAEQILEAYKPVCNEFGLYLRTSDQIASVGGRNYITATASVIVASTGEACSAQASAWEGNVPISNSGNEILDTSQVSGKTSSYAKKYALQNLFAIDDTADADQDGDEVVYNSAPSPVDLLPKAKRTINKKLEELGYSTIPEKSDKIGLILGKNTIDNIKEAEKVMDVLEDYNG